ncbi:MAG TPA: hypothetical protein DDZ66_00480 [Firmicutes bacterium]|nr:hypothetical protein [Bacillota bacterium]
MELQKRSYQVLKWTTRILAAAIVIFGLPFYFGYGNPLPFINPEYSIWDNTWLTVLPLMFIGLGLGWKWPKTGGLLITVPILLGFILGLIVRGGMAVHMLIPLIVGTLYMVLGCAKARQ